MDIPTIDYLEKEQREKLKALRDTVLQIPPFALDKALSRVNHNAGSGGTDFQTTTSSGTVEHWRSYKQGLLNFIAETIDPLISANDKETKLATTALEQLAAQKKRVLDEAIGLLPPAKKPKG
jgi:hypothetical protein